MTDHVRCLVDLAALWCPIGNTELLGSIKVG